MAKIETYILATQPLSFSDMLIGTEVNGPIPNATKNFSLGELYNLFASFPAVGNLQQTLNAGNTATQNIFLTGDIESTTIKPDYIIDGLNSTGAVGETIIRSFSGISWGPIPIPVVTLQTVLNAGNTATQNIVLTGNVTSTQIIPGNIKDEVGNLGTSGQVLSKTAIGIRWINPPSAVQVNSDWNATSGVAEILNKPTIPAAQVNSDWNAVSGVAEILNKPTIPSAFTLQQVLDAGNTATQSITLIGFIKPTNITDNTNNNGALNQILSIGAGGLQWINAPATSPLTTKGDLYTFNTVNARLPVGLDTQILLADSTTPTGLKWGTNTAATPLGYYGAFSDITNQTAAVVNTGYPMLLGVTDLSNGVTVVSGSRVTIANTGIYNIQWSAQFRNPTANIHDVTIWLRKNGVDVPGSSGIVAVTAKHGGFDGHVLPSWNFLLDAVAGDYYEFVWSTDNTSVYISFNPAGNPPPSTASVVLTVTQQSGIMAGTGITAINSLTGSVQTLGVGTSGTDFAIVSSGTSHTFNLPTASATNRGALSSTDWATFNNKQNAITLTTTGSGAATFIADVLNIPTPTFLGWSLTGNAGTSASTNFIGTTDAVDFVQKANNRSLLRLSATNATADTPIYIQQYFGIPAIYPGAVAANSTAFSLLLQGTNTTINAPNGNTVLQGSGVSNGYFGGLYSNIAKPMLINEAATGTTTPAASSILEVTSTTKGFLPPRMTTVQRNAIASPASGLVIYNTTSSAFNYYNGSTWIELMSGGNQTFVGTKTFSTRVNTAYLELTAGSPEIYYSGVIKIGGTTAGILIGSGASQSAGGISIGSSASSSGGVAIGVLSAITGGANTYSVSIGNRSSATGSQQSLAIGGYSKALHNGSIAINGAITEAANQFVAGNMIFPSGSENSPITEVYFGSGVRRGYNQFGTNVYTDGVGLSYSINGSGANGTDFAGGSITIAGGKGTGSGTSGDVIFSTSTVGSSGSTLQTLTNRWFVKGNTGILSNTSTPDASAALNVESTTRGFLPPRMTNAQRLAITSPAIGLMVYCTDVVEGLYINKSTGWTFVI